MLERMTKLLAELKDISSIKVTEDTLLTSDIGLASLDYFELINKIEDEFHVSISDKELLQFKTVGDIIKCIKSKA